MTIQPKKPTTAQRVRVLEHRLAMVEDVLNFVVNAQERSNVVVAEMMLKSAGTNLEEFLASSGTSFQQEEDTGTIKELTEEEAEKYEQPEYQYNPTVSGSHSVYDEGHY